MDVASSLRARKKITHNNGRGKGNGTMLRIEFFSKPPNGGGTGTIIKWVEHLRLGKRRSSITGPEGTNHDAM